MRSNPLLNFFGFVWPLAGSTRIKIRAWSSAHWLKSTKLILPKCHSSTWYKEKHVVKQKGQVLQQKNMQCLQHFLLNLLHFCFRCMVAFSITYHHFSKFWNDCVTVSSSGVASMQQMEQLLPQTAQYHFCNSCTSNKIFRQVSRGRVG